MASNEMEIGTKSVSLTSTSYWTMGSGLSDAYMLENVVIINFSFTSSDTVIPTGGYYAFGTVSVAPKSDITFIYHDNDGKRFAIKIKSNGDIEIYNYQSSSAHIGGGCLFAYRIS